MVPVLEATVGTAVTPLDNIRVTRVDDADSFNALRWDWNALLADSAANGPFLTWEWLSAWWAHLAGAARLQVLAAWDGSALIGIGPFMVTESAFGWFPRLEFLGTGHAGSDYLDLIVRRGCEPATLRAFARAIGHQRYTTRFDHVPAASLSAQLAEQLRFEGWTSSTVADGVCPVIDLTGHTWDSFLATVGPSHRANIRRRLRGLEKQFDTRFERVIADDLRREALEALCRFHSDRFEAEGGSTAFLNTAVRAFQEDATRLTLERGWLRMYVLRLDGAIGAVMYGFNYAGTFYFYQHGFDPRHQRHSIGLVLMAMTIRAAIDEGARTFDLLWGTEGYKSLWTRDAKALRRIDLFPAHFGGRLHKGAVAARRRLGPLARRVLTLGDVRDA
jgi:CelD/BcsL family acetyltransferase involved in cellulose biosynthesis